MGSPNDWPRSVPGCVPSALTLECRLHRFPGPHLVAGSSAPDLPVALNEVRTDMIRQVDHAKTRTEPRHNRALRHTAVPPTSGV
ncbi:hypothetical protein [Amycolatopsis sp. cmx-11-12]|uniref:hypothetical protein n=1 Tax=Amycolatopsis sp. cmx-11-12 TaxID=2785795 RepID=UPI0039181E87